MIPRQPPGKKRGGLGANSCKIRGEETCKRPLLDASRRGRFFLYGGGAVIAGGAKQ